MESVDKKDTLKKIEIHDKMFYTYIRILCILLFDILFLISNFNLYLRKHVLFPKIFFSICVSTEIST